MSNKLKGIIFTLIGGSLWGFSGVCGQYLFQIKNIDPQWLSAWRLFASGLMILIFLIPKEKKNVFNVFFQRYYCSCTDILFCKCYGLSVFLFYGYLLF